MYISLLELKCPPRDHSISNTSIFCSSRKLRVLKRICGSEEDQVSVCVCVQCMRLDCTKVIRDRRGCNIGKWFMGRIVGGARYISIHDS